MFPPLSEKIGEAVRRLEEQIAAAEGEGAAPADEVAKAKAALESFSTLPTAATNRHLRAAEAQDPSPRSANPQCCSVRGQPSPPLRSNLERLHRWMAAGADAVALV